MKNIISFLIVISFSFLPFLDGAHADPLPDYEFHDLNDNQVPAGWILEVQHGNGGIQDGRLIARIVDAEVFLKRLGTLPAGAAGIKLEYDGNMAYSSNGMVNGVGLMAGADTFCVNAGIRYGVQTHRVMIWKNSPYVPGGLIFDSSYALEYTDFHYAVEFTQGQIKYKAVKISDASTVFNIVVSDSRLDLSKVQGISFSAYATTDNDCWVDNISVEVIVCGDCNRDGVVDIGDVVFLINNLFKGGPSPDPSIIGDVNKDNTVDIGDVVYLINYLFKGGPSPCESSLLSSPNNSMTVERSARTAQIALSQVEISGENQPGISILGAFHQNIAGVQLEISYDPKDITLLEPSLATRTEGLQLYSNVKDGVLKIGILDISGQNYIAPGEGPLVTLRVKGSDFSSLVIKGAIFVDKDANKIPVEIVKSISTMENHSVPQEFTLSQNIPNPFNPETEISYFLPSACQVKLSIYNLLGEKVSTLVDGYQTTGHKTVRWDGTDDLGNKVASGVYFYKLKAGEFTETKKMIMMK